MLEDTESVKQTDLGMTMETVMPKAARTTYSLGTYFVPSAPIDLECLTDYPGYDGILAPQAMPEICPCPVDSDRYGATWQEYTPALAARFPSKKSNRNFRVFFTDQYGRELHAESYLEYTTILMLLADREVAEVRAQPDKLKYRDAEGRERSHFIDLLAITHDDRRIAMAIKPEAKRRSSGIDDEVAALRRDNPGFADDILVRTDADIAKNALANARLVLRSQRICTADHVRELAMVAARLTGGIRVGALLRHYRDDGIGFAACVLLIQAGLLEPSRPDRISRRMVVRWSGAPAASPHQTIPLRPSDVAASIILA